MKLEKEPLIVNRLRDQRLNRNVSPSLRIAATTHNRSLLRWLRAVEAIAWQDAGTLDQIPSGFDPQNGEGRFDLLGVTNAEKQ